MHFLPQGYISLQDVRKALIDRLHPGDGYKPIRFYCEEAREGEKVRIETPDLAKADQAEGRRQTEEAVEILLSALKRGELKALVFVGAADIREIPLWYWTDATASATVRFGELQSGRRPESIWHECFFKPCMLLKPEFENWMTGVGPLAGSGDQASEESFSTPGEREPDQDAADARNPTAVPRRRRRDPASDPTQRNKYERVVAEARRRWPKDPLKPRPDFRQMARLLHEKKGNEWGFAEETIRKILEGRYQPAIRLGVRGLDG